MIALLFLYRCITDFVARRSPRDEFLTRVSYRKEPFAIA